MQSSTSCSTQRTARVPMRIGLGNRDSAISAYTDERDRAVATVTSRRVRSLGMAAPALACSGVACGFVVI